MLLLFTHLDVQFLCHKNNADGLLQGKKLNGSLDIGSKNSTPTLLNSNLNQLEPQTIQSFILSKKTVDDKMIVSYSHSLYGRRIEVVRGSIFNQWLLNRAEYFHLWIHLFIFSFPFGVPVINYLYCSSNVHHGV